MHQRGDYFVLLDPDGSDPNGWLSVIVRANTGVFYEAQCAGVHTMTERAEGFLVPASGIGAANKRVAWKELTDVFHRGKICLSPRLGEGHRLDASRIETLRETIAIIPFWTLTRGGRGELVTMALDETQLGNAVEGWVPVTTPYGDGVLTWPNCD